VESMLKVASRWIASVCRHTPSSRHVKKKKKKKKKVQ